MTTPGLLHIGVLSLGGNNWMGGAEYTKNLVSAVIAATSDGHLGSVHLSLLHGSDDRSLHDQFEGLPQVSLVPVMEPTAHSFAYRAARRLGLNLVDKRLARQCRELGLDFLYPYDGNPRELDTRAAAWIADFQHLRLPRFFSHDDITSRSSRFESIASNAATVVLSSESAARDFREFYPSAGDKAQVLPFRVTFPKPFFAASPDAIREKYNIPRRFVLVSNQFWQHKNHIALFKAMQLAIRTEPSLNVVMTGKLVDHRRAGYCDEILAHLQSLGIHHHARLLGLIPKLHQVQLLRCAAAVVQPSLFEGWNTAVEEAIALGRPLIVSDITTHREQCGPDAMYFDPQSPAELAEKLVECFSGRENAWSREVEHDALTKYAPRIVGFGEHFIRIASAL